MPRLLLLIHLATANEVCLLQTGDFLERAEPSALTTSLLAARASHNTELADELEDGDGGTDYLEVGALPDGGFPTSPWSFTLPVQSVATALTESLGRSLDALTGNKKIDLSKRKYQEFMFVHIPKTAGTSLVKDLKEDTAVNQSGANLVGWEWCLPPHLSTNSDVMNMMMFRSPRAHVFSQFLECKYDWWGKIVTANTDFPREPDDIDGFTRWIEHFQVAEDDESVHCDCDVTHWKVCPCMQKSDYNCYNPHNMQARALTCTGASTIHSHHVFEDTGLTPSQHDALEAIGKLQWTGILELYDESLCLFFYDALGELRDNCQCGKEIAHSHMKHNVPPHDVDDLSEKAIEMVDAVTAVDRPIYKAAVMQFLRELRKVEQAEGVKMLCKEKIDALKKSTSYIEGMADALDAHGIFGAGGEIEQQSASDSTGQGQEVEKQSASDSAGKGDEVEQQSASDNTGQGQEVEEQSASDSTGKGDEAVQQSASDSNSE